MNSKATYHIDVNHRRTFTVEAQCITRIINVRNFVHGSGNNFSIYFRTYYDKND
jgi:hypothetical protein